MIKRLVDHLASVGKPRRFHFNHHIEATQHGRIDVANRIGSPKRDDRIFFQKAVDFTLVGASAEKERSQVVEDVFGFVNHQNIGIGLRKDVARSLPELQSRGTLLFLSRFLFGELHFVTGETQFLGNDTRKFRFAAARRSVKEDVDAFALAGYGRLEVGEKNAAHDRQMRKVFDA